MSGSQDEKKRFLLCLLPVEMRCFSFAGGVAVHGPPVPRPAEPASAEPASGGASPPRPSHVAPPSRARASRRLGAGTSVHVHVGAHLVGEGRLRE